MATNDDLTVKVKEILKTCATQGKLVAFNEIERRIGQSISGWKGILDPVSQECRAHGHPDLTVIVIFKATGYPAFFHDIWVGRSKPFDPKNLKQLERWQDEVSRLFEQWKVEAWPRQAVD